MEEGPKKFRFEVSGDALAASIDGFGAFRDIAIRHLANLGILKPENPVIDRLGWYPQEASLAAFARITEEAGPGVLFEIGQRLPDNLQLPPFVVDIHSSIRAVDLAYHINHRKDGVVMFNEVTGKMLEGIGHYGNQAVLGEKKIISVCDTPYPCELDRGALYAMSAKFEPRAQVVHEEGTLCRKMGGRSCTYVITW